MSGSRFTQRNKPQHHGSRKSFHGKTLTRMLRRFNIMP
jgi:hypothetical protein